MSNPELKLIPFHGGQPIAIKLAGQTNDLLAVMYTVENDPNWYWIERPIEYYLDGNGHCHLKRWMYLSCTTLFQVRAVDILSHGELNDSVIMLYMASLERYYSDLRETELEEIDIPDTLEEAETPTEDTPEDTVCADAAQDVEEPSATPDDVPQPKKTKKQIQEDNERLLFMLRNMPDTKIRH